MVRKDWFNNLIDIGIEDHELSIVSILLPELAIIEPFYLGTNQSVLGTYELLLKCF